MWNYLRSCVLWLHEPDHVAKFQQYFGVIPEFNRKSKCENFLNKNNNSNNLRNNNDDDTFLIDDINCCRSERKINYDLLNEHMKEIKGSTSQNETDEEISEQVDYKIISWFWYYFFHFATSLGNEIFYILFFPIW